MNCTERMSARYKDCMYWLEKEEWYTFDRNKNRFFLTEKATEEARRSFEMYKRINWRRYKDGIIDYERI